MPRNLDNKKAECFILDFFMLNYSERYLYACIPAIDPKIGASKYIKSKDLIPKATAGFIIPFAPSKAETAIPKNNENFFLLFFNNKICSSIKFQIFK